jgi:hypothetical protein
MEGSVLSFLKAEWKVSDTDSAHWAIRFTGLALINIKEKEQRLVDSIFASQGLRSALLIFTLGIVRRILKVTRWRFICNAASGSCNQSERALRKAHVLWETCQQNKNEKNR